MSFGVSSDPGKSDMVGGDVVVAWVNRLTGKGFAQDYFLEAKSQCSGTRGSCPDNRLKDNSNSVRLLNAAIVNVRTEKHCLTFYFTTCFQEPILHKTILFRTIQL